jgi:hypothetical protein
VLEADKKEVKIFANLISSLDKIIVASQKSG